MPESGNFSPAFLGNLPPAMTKINSEQEFESLIYSCYSTRTGEIHGDPQDWVNLKSEYSNLIKIYSEIDNTFEYPALSFLSKITEDDLPKKAMLTISANKKDISLNMIDDFIKEIRQSLHENCDLSCLIGLDMKVLKKDEVRIVLITS